MSLSTILAAIKAAFTEAPEDEDSKSMIVHVPVMATDEWREWHEAALKRARERHNKPFTWGARLERNGK